MEGRRFTLALCGDVILNTRVSTCLDDAVLDTLRIVRHADVAYGDVEVPLHDFDDPDAFPAAEGALSWMSAPTWVAEELRWCGFDLVSIASNHALDYSYGGLKSTMAPLRRARIPFAGAGLDLGEARSPAFSDTRHGRIALVSAVSSFPTFARAGSARSDMTGRPGVNALRYRHVIDPTRAAVLSGLFSDLGFWVTRMGREFTVNPPGMHNSILRFEVEQDRTEVSSRCDEDDLDGICSAVAYARSASDMVIAHLHCHEWDPVTGNMASSPTFAAEFAERVVAAGASVAIVQGSHAPMRGIQIVGGVPVLYDPGPLYRLGRRDRQPQDFYDRWGNPKSLRDPAASIVEAFQSREGALGGPGTERVVESPAVGLSHDPGFVIPVCHVDPVTYRITEIDLHPARWAQHPKSLTGFPTTPTEEAADAILERMACLSAAYGTTVSLRDRVGHITLDDRD